MSDARFELKKISSDAIENALERANHYRLLNEPEQAQSICLDIHRVEPGNQRNLILLVLTITDQLGSKRAHPDAAEALEYLSQLTDEYQRTYFTGLVKEREARAFLDRGLASVFAYEGLREAMEWYEKAEAIRPPGNDEALLRWNSCARTIEREKLHPRDSDDTPQLLE